jgi:hypothetical protein
VHRGRSEGVRTGKRKQRECGSVLRAARLHPVIGHRYHIPVIRRLRVGSDVAPVRLIMACTSLLRELGRDGPSTLRICRATEGSPGTRIGPCTGRAAGRVTFHHEDLAERRVLARAVACSFPWHSPDSRGASAGSVYAPLRAARRVADAWTPCRITLPVPVGCSQTSRRAGPLGDAPHESICDGVFLRWSRSS